MPTAIVSCSCQNVASSLLSPGFGLAMVPSRPFQICLRQTGRTTAHLRRLLITLNHTSIEG